MKLYASTTSPFVRKISILLIETGLEARVEKIIAATSPVKPNAQLAATNPLGKIPALVLDDGTVLFDSRVIMQYLDTLHQEAKFYPEAGAARFRVMRDEALADGILDALILCRYETFLRPPEKQWSGWIDAQMAKATNGLQMLDKEMPHRKAFNSNGNDAGLTAMVGVFGYLDFRRPDFNWRANYPNLAAFERDFATRPAVKATIPRE